MQDDKNKKWILPILNVPIVYNDLEITFLDFFEAVHPPGFTANTHRHPYYEFYFVQEGAFCTTIEDSEFIAEANSFFLIPPGIEHCNRSVSDSGDAGICVRWLLKKRDMEVWQNERPVADEVINTFSKYHAFGIPYPVEWILQYINNKSVSIIETTFVNWLMFIKQAVKSYADNSDEEVTLRNIGIVSQVVQLLEKEYASEFAITSIADSLGYSYRHLARLFKDAVGMRITEKLNTIRIKKAIELLESTDMSIKEISNAVGFKSESYFATVFSEHTHILPSKYRKRAENSDMWISG